jgi:pimeloyl-ACP methyl ester carboxylesterase
VRTPLLILHGERDVTVPIAHGERLYARANKPKRMIRFPGAGHNGLDEHGAVDAVLQFLAALGEPKPTGAAPSRDPGETRVSPL